jgi:hypothetical protein
MSEIMCPRCSNIVSEVLPLETGLIEYLKAAGEAEIHPAVCGNCQNEIRSSMGRGGVLLAREKAKEDNRRRMWKSRVGLIKKARQAMLNKSFSEAAVAYEKYVRILEVVFDVKPGELRPELFKDSARTSELTVVAGVYWDLLRIYDTSDKYGPRQQLAAKQLANFLRFTPIYPDIVKKADVFSRTARNPAAVKLFLKAAGENKSRCFIATAAFSHPFCEEVFALQEFRDKYLSHNKLGRAFIKIYYFVSPKIAEFIDKNPGCKRPVAAVLRRLIQYLPR